MKIHKSLLLTNLLPQILKGATAYYYAMWCSLGLLQSEFRLSLLLILYNLWDAFYAHLLCTLSSMQLPQHHPLYLLVSFKDKECLQHLALKVLNSGWLFEQRTMEKRKQIAWPCLSSHVLPPWGQIGAVGIQEQQWDQHSCWAVTVCEAQFSWLGTQPWAGLVWSLDVTCKQLVGNTKAVPGSFPQRLGNTYPFIHIYVVPTVPATEEKAQGSQTFAARWQTTSGTALWVADLLPQRASPLCIPCVEERTRERGEC